MQIFNVQKRKTDLKNCMGTSPVKTSSGLDSTLSKQGAWVESLVRELRPCICLAQESIDRQTEIKLFGIEEFSFPSPQCKQRISGQNFYISTNSGPDPGETMTSWESPHLQVCHIFNHVLIYWF